MRKRLPRVQRAGGSELVPDVGACPCKIVTEILRKPLQRHRRSAVIGIVLKDKQMVGARVFLASMGSRIYRYDVLVWFLLFQCLETFTACFPQRMGYNNCYCYVTEGTIRHTETEPSIT